MRDRKTIEKEFGNPRYINPDQITLISPEQDNINVIKNQKLILEVLLDIRDMKKNE